LAVVVVLDLVDIESVTSVDVLPTAPTLVTDLMFDWLLADNIEGLTAIGGLFVELKTPGDAEICFCLVVETFITVSAAINSP